MTSVEPSVTRIASELVSMSGEKVYSLPATAVPSSLNLIYGQLPFC